MKERISSELGEMLDLKIFTIHSFLLSILKAFPYEAGLDPDFEIADDDSIRQVLYQNINEITKIASKLTISLDLNIEGLLDLTNKIVNYESFDFNPANLRSHTFKTIRNNNEYSLDDLELLNISLTQDLLEFKVKLNDILSQEIGRKRITFSQIISKAENLLNNPDIKEWVLYKIDSGIDHLMIDEAQDITIDQIRVLQSIIDNCISDESKSIFIVGDIKQSIYSFQGSNSDYFLKFLDNVINQLKFHNKSHSIEYLNSTYRSSKAIIDFVNDYFNNPSSLSALKVTNDFTHNTLNNLDGKIVKHIINSKTAKNDIIASKIIEIIHEKLSLGEKLNDIMILVRNRGTLFSTIKDYLDSNNIKYLSRESIVMNDHPLFKDIITIIRHIFLNITDFSINRIHHIYPDYENFRSYILENKLSIMEFLSIFYKQYCNCLRSLYNEFDRIYDISYSFIYKEYAGSIIELLEKMLGFAKIVYIEAEGEGVKLMTIHGSKGLENKFVIIADFDNKVNTGSNKFEYSHENKTFIYNVKSSLRSKSFESILQEQKSLMLEESERLTYVAFTRAKEELHIICKS